jgi:polysaccharide export outer membrane protein
VTFRSSFAVRVIVLFTSVALVAGCGLPRSGPNKREILSGSVDKKGDAFVVTVTPEVSRLTAVQPSFGFSDSFRSAGVVASDMISSGDEINITVYENVKDDPLLGNTGQRVSGLSTVQVDGQGYIFIPYAGRIKAAGQTNEGLRQAITRKLEGQTPDPQVSVSRMAGVGSTVSISGQAGANGVYPIDASTRTLATMLAKSGGVTIDPATAIVRVTRGGHTGKIWLKDLYENPSLDIALRPGDKIMIEEDSRKFIALGPRARKARCPSFRRPCRRWRRLPPWAACRPWRPTRRASSSCATKAKRLPAPFWAGLTWSATSASSTC